MAALPTEVREADTSKTNIYQQGKLVYDGATGLSTAAAPAPSDAALRAGAGMNELLSWGIRNSDPAELKRRAEAGTKELTPLDKEMLDMLLGQPAVAQMRACLVKLEPGALQQAEGEEAALGALEELEFHCEDADNANDLSKIGGIQALLQASATAGDADVREGSCGVLAAAMQNNPPFQQAAIALGVPAALLGLLEPSQPLSVQRKALLALSALLRSGGEGAATVLALEGTMATLMRAAGSDDAKLRRRGLFLLLVLVRDGAVTPATLEAQRAALAPAVLGALSGEDVEARETAAQLLLLLRSADALRTQLATELGAEAALGGALESIRAEAAAGGEADHSDVTEWLTLLLSWLRGEPWRPGLGVAAK